MMFALGFISGVLVVLALFVFSTWKRNQINNVIRKIEDNFVEAGGFIEPIDPEVRAAAELKTLFEK